MGTGGFHFARIMLLQAPLEVFCMAYIRPAVFDALKDIYPIFRHFSANLGCV